MWPFDDDSALPLREGVDVGGAQERQMAVIAGGYGGVRTVEERNQDGSITTLRTRGGNPIFETTAARLAGASSAILRGFVAKATSRAVLFDPYTLEVLDANYTLATNAYTVMDFATAWNVPTGDDTHWYDVVLFDGTTIKVNAKAMPTLLITANHGFPAIPYVINRETAEDQYGNAERNTTEKRVFAVGRSDVKAWGGGGVTETLTPTAPRSESRAMTIGQRLDFASDKAWLGQLYHPAAGWDAAGEWAFTSAEVTMLLASAYLSKVSESADVAMSVAEFGSPATSSGSSSASTTMPPTEISIVGIPEYGSGSEHSRSVIWPFREKNIGPLNGATNTNYTKTTYSGYVSSSVVADGRTLVFEENNSAEFYANVDTLEVLDTVDLPPTATANNSLQSLLSATGTNPSIDTFFWFEPSGPNGHRGQDTMPVAAQTVGTANSTTNIQNASFSVMLGGVSLVSGQAYRRKEGGNKTIPTGTSTRLDPYIAAPYGWLGTETDLGVHMQLAILGDYTANSLSVNMGSSEEEQGLLQSKADEWMAVKYYPNGALMSGPWYSATTGPKDAVDTSTMDWESKDYLLYDDTNDVYITIEGAFSGVDTVASLTVILKVQTRHHTTTQTLGEYSYTYSQLVQEREIGSTGKYAMPSPQIRAIFAPLYQEQGSFKGAHYVTQDEEGDGATPAHLFNFLLYLRPYGDIGTINDDNLSSQAVHFVPCNLLEMLYAFVFSQEYGVAESGERYPVTFTTRYNDMMNTLFSSPVRVAVRDGAQVAWSDAFGPDFASIPTVSLHRT